MFERYTDRVRRAIVLAQENARVLRHLQIDVDHMLLGLADNADSIALRAPALAGISIGTLRDAVAQQRAAAESPVSGRIPITQEADRVIRNGALREAFNLGHRWVGTEHLLLAVASYCEHHSDSSATSALAACGVEPRDVREAVMTLLNGHGGPSAGASA